MLQNQWVRSWNHMKIVFRAEGARISIIMDGNGKITLESHDMSSELEKEIVDFLNNTNSGKIKPLRFAYTQLPRGLRW
jgi:hypothetical protein